MDLLGNQACGTGQNLRHKQEQSCVTAEAIHKTYII